MAPKAPPPPPPTKPKAPPRPPGNGASAPAANKTFGVSSGRTLAAHKVVVYGPGGIGKTSLCALLQQVGVSPLFLDLDDGSQHLDVPRITPRPETYDDVRLACRFVAASADHHAIVVDSLTVLEEMTIAHVIANVRHEKGHCVKSVEGYGYGKGFTHVYEAFLLVLQDLDAVVRSGKHVICTAHDCTANVPNPSGEDWIRYEPRLQSPNSGKASIRLRVKEWCDHLFYVGYDAAVNEDGKATGVGSRTIYPSELPTHLAKSRTLADPIPYVEGDPELWNQLFAKE